MFYIIKTIKRIYIYTYICVHIRFPNRNSNLYPDLKKQQCILIYANMLLLWKGVFQQFGNGFC